MKYEVLGASLYAYTGGKEFNPAQPTAVFIHGVLNNYLDTDKASVPFWGFIAILVALDLYHRKPSAQNIEHS